MKKLNVLHVIGSMNSGGAETFLMNIFRKADRQKFNFYFLCYSDEKFDYEDEIYRLGGTIIRIKYSYKRIIQNVKQIKEIIKKYDIDIVHAHTYYNSVFSVIAAKQCKISSIVHAHSTKSVNSPNFLQKIYYAISKQLIRKNISMALACSEVAGKAMLGENVKYQVLKNGIEISNFKYNKDKRKEVRNKYSIVESDTVFCCVARFEEVKNQSFLVDVFKEYHEMNKNSKLILVGRGSLKEKIAEKVENLGLKNDVIFTGVLSDVNLIYNASDLFVLPSLFEGLGIVLIEAQTNGLVCFASDNIPHEVDVTGNTHFLKLELGAKEWANIISNTDLSRYDEEEKVRDSGYSISDVTKKLEKIYLELVW